MALDFSHRMFIVITGASQGIGQTLALELSNRISNDSMMVLIARSEDGLKLTRSKITNEKVTVRMVPLDLTHPNLEELQQIFTPKPVDFDTAIVFHNVGQIGNLTKSTELTDLDQWRNYYDLNVFSVAILNSVFMQNCRPIPNVFVINITSLVGRQPFKNMVMYGSGKAARELYFRVFALEEPKINVLNYSPGPVDTLMVGEIIENATDPDLKSMFVDMKEKGTILTAAQTIGKLLLILHEGSFKSGDVIDYFDRI